MKIYGNEVVHSVRKVVMEVPHDMTDEETKCVNADNFNDVEERTDWEIIDSDGLYARGFPSFVELAPDDATPDLQIVRDENGEYRVRKHSEPQFV